MNYSLTYREKSLKHIATLKFQHLPKIFKHSNASVKAVGYIEAIYVKPDHRTQGIARKLAEIAEQWAKERGCTEMASDTEIKNVDSQKFHKKIGFEHAETIVHFIKKVG